MTLNNRLSMESRTFSTKIWTGLETTLKGIHASCTSSSVEKYRLKMAVVIHADRLTKEQ